MLSPIPILALLFDLDGLLVDSEPTWFKVEGAFLARFGHTWTRQLADACIGQGTPNTLRYWQQRYGIDVDIDRDTQIILAQMADHAHEMPLKPGAIELMEAAGRHNLPMAVASSSRRFLVEAVLKSKQIRDRFAVVVTGDDVVAAKPAPDLFLLAAQQLRIPPANCLVLEDSLAGVRAGVAAGCQVVAIPSVRCDEIPRLAHSLAEDLQQVIALLGWAQH